MKPNNEIQNVFDDALVKQILGLIESNRSKEKSLYIRQRIEDQCDLVNIDIQSVLVNNSDLYFIV